MIAFLAMVVTVAILASVFTVWKYRRDIILGVIAWVAVRYYERRR